MTSATKLADATGKGVVCIVTSTTVNNVQATAALYSPTTDPANGTGIVITGGIQSADASSQCATAVPTTTAWIQMFGADLHRATGADVVYVSFN